VVIAVVAVTLSVIALALPAFRAVPAPTTREFLLSADVVNASNRWYPSNLIAYAGDTIVFNATNRGTITHGFTVDGLGIQAVLDPGENQRFTAQSVGAGLYRYYCHLHGAHIGGQLLVLAR
jgi:plastocyanin